MVTSGKKYSVLIVDDDKFLLDMYALKFSEQGFDVHTAFSGTDALAKLQAGSSKMDIILLDVVMPGVDGFDVLQEVKKNKLAPQVKIIILSNLGAKEDIDKGMALGADGYIVKASATPSEVVKKVLEIIELKHT